MKIHNLNKLHLPLSTLTIYSVTKLKLCKRYFCFIFVDIGEEYVKLVTYFLSKLVNLLLAYCISTRSGHARSKDLQHKDSSFTKVSIGIMQPVINLSGFTIIRIISGELRKSIITDRFQGFRFVDNNCRLR